MYDTIDQNLELEVIKEKKMNKIRPPLSKGTSEEKFNLDSCPAYAPVASKSENVRNDKGGVHETVSTM